MDDYKKVNFSWPTCVLCLLANYFSEIFPIFLILDVLIQKSLFIKQSEGAITQVQPQNFDYEDEFSKNSSEDDISSVKTGGQKTNQLKNYRAIELKQLKFIENVFFLFKNFSPLSFLKTRKYAHSLVHYVQPIFKVQKLK